MHNIDRSVHDGPNYIFDDRDSAMQLFGVFHATTNLTEAQSTITAVMDDVDEHRSRYGSSYATQATASPSTRHASKTMPVTAAR